MVLSTRGDYWWCGRRLRHAFTCLRSGPSSRAGIRQALDIVEVHAHGDVLLETGSWSCFYQVRDCLIRLRVTVIFLGHDDNPFPTCRFGKNEAPLNRRLIRPKCNNLFHSMSHILCMHYSFKQKEKQCIGTRNKLHELSSNIHMTTCMAIGWSS